LKCGNPWFALTLPSKQQHHLHASFIFIFIFIFILFKMPKKPSVKKNAAAEFQSIKAIRAAATGDARYAFMSVQSAKGNGYFMLRTAMGRDVRGTPRGLFTSGSMRISAGQIVVVEGDAALGVEIVGVMSDRHDCEQLVRKGRMPREVLASAISAGGVSGGVAEEDDLFEKADEVVSGAVADCRGGMVASRAMAASRAAVSSRVAQLLAAATDLPPLTEAEIDAI